MTIHSGENSTLSPGPGEIGKCEGLCAAEGGAHLVSVEKSKVPASLGYHLFFPQPSPPYLLHLFPSAARRGGQKPDPLIISPTTVGFSGSPGATD